MYPDQKRIYTVAALFLGVLLLVAFVPNLAVGNFLLAALTAGFAAAGWFLIPKRSALAITRREVTLVMAVMGPVVIMLLYLTGLRFGFYRTPLQSHHWWQYIIPYLIAIPAAELLRSVLLQQKKRWVSILAYIAMVVLDLSVFSQSNILDSFSRFREFMAMVLFPAIIGNLLYQHLSARYGALPGSIYRLVLALYPYLLPWAPGIPSSLLAFGRLVIPLIILLFISKLYEKRKFSVSRRKSIANALCTGLLLVAMALVVMLISNQFRYGLLVVGSESMTGSIDKGDAVVYEAYTDQVITEGQVAVFKSGKSNFIHRVVDVTHTDGELRIYTKGDANDSNDDGYVTTEDMIGIVKLTLKNIGYPTIWMRELFR